MINNKKGTKSARYQLNLHNSFFYTNETIPKVTVVYFSLNFTHFCRLAISHAPAPPTFPLCFENEQIEYVFFISSFVKRQNKSQSKRGNNPGYVI